VVDKARLTPDQMEQLRELVMTRWDPIGVHFEANNAEDRACYWDEYDMYLPVMVERARRAGADGLRDYLETVRTVDIGLEARADVDRRAADAIVKWLSRIEPADDAR
jgi:hypothetical protein